jgi:hypothetical protein
MTSSVHVNEPTSHNRRNISGSLWEFFEIYSAIGLVYSLTAPFLTLHRYFDTSSLTLLSFGEAISVQKHHPEDVGQSMPVRRLAVRMGRRCLCAGGEDIGSGD